MLNSENKNAIILFDGVCNLCNFWVNFILKRDKNEYFMFAALQSETGKRLIEKYNLTGSILPDSVILIENNKAYFKSAAAFRIVKKLNGGWQIISVLRFLPIKLSDFFYDVVAKNRYKWFGKNDVCMLPELKWQKRFL